MPESLLAVVLALILVFGGALGVLRVMGPAENHASPSEFDGKSAPDSEQRVL
jgi:hypothetical protein